MSSARVALGIAGRNIVLIPRIPSTFIPPLVMPLFMTIAFSGAMSDVVRLPGFPAQKAIDWFLPMAMVMGASFGGLAVGMAMVRDIETGFFDRMLSSPASRSALLAGPLMAAAVRGLIPLALLLVVALIGGAHFAAGWLGVGTAAAAAVGMALIGAAWSMALALRFKTQQAAPLMQSGVFLGVFLSTAQMPLHLLGGWLHDVARVNPISNILALAREGFIGDVTWAGTWPGLASIAGIFALLLVFAATSLRKVIP